MSNIIAGIDPEILTKAIREMRDKALFDDEGPSLGPSSEQYYLLAIGALEQAERFATLATYNLRQKQ